MHCWKTYNVNKKYHFYRYFIISSFVALLIFILTYAPMQLVTSAKVSDNYFIIFVCLFILIYPVHKIFHTLPILPYYKDIKLEIDFYFFILPIININVKRALPITHYIFALLCPFFVINSLLVIAIVLLPQYSHYITILLAYHTGICAVDFKIAKSLISSPSGSLIEESENGYEILVNDQ